MPESLILFDQELWKQLDGVAMGSSLVPKPVVFLCYHEKRGFKIVHLHLNLLSIEGKLMIHSYFFALNKASKTAAIPKVLLICASKNT